MNAMKTLKVNREFLVRHLAVCLLMLGMGCWFGYDGLVTYRRAPAAELYEKIESAKPPEGFPLEAFKEHTSYSAAEFIRHCVKKFPYAIECVQTDNGSEFTNRMNGSKTVRPTFFQKTLDELGIQHKLIKVFTPRHNGKVERSHRKDNEYFYASHKFYSFEDFQKQLAVWQYKYNDFPMRPLNWRSPKQVLFSFPDV